MQRCMVYAVLKRFWVPLLLTVVVAIGAYAIVRIRDSGHHTPAVAEQSGGITANFNPKHITYDVTGSGGER